MAGAIVESGSASLSIGAIGDGQFLKRSGTSIVGAAAPGGSEAFPVGSVFVAAVSTDPNTLLGYGTWARIAEGQFPVGYKTGDSDFGTLKATGGAKTTTPAGTIGGTSAGTPAGTIDAVGAGTPAGTVAWPTGGGNVPTFTGSSNQTTSTASTGASTVGSTTPSTLTLRNHTHTLTPAGTVAWPAGVPTFSGTALGTHTHTFSGTALGTHTHSFSGGSTPILPPFVVLYFWERTA